MIAGPKPMLRSANVMQGTRDFNAIMSDIYLSILREKIASFLHVNLASHEFGRYVVESDRQFEQDMSEMNREEIRLDKFRETHLIKIHV